MGEVQTASDRSHALVQMVVQLEEVRRGLHIREEFCNLCMRLHCNFATHRASCIRLSSLPSNVCLNALVCSCMATPTFLPVVNCSALVKLCSRIDSVQLYQLYVQLKHAAPCKLRFVFFP